jgi:hypothetical protein
MFTSRFLLIVPRAESAGQSPVGIAMRMISLCGSLAIVSVLNMSCLSGSAVTYHIEIQPQRIESIVAFIELRKISGGADFQPPQTQRTVSISVLSSLGNQFEMKVKRTYMRAIYWYFEALSYRVTFFAPGYIATTLYPDGGSIPGSDGKRTVAIEPTVGWRRHNRPMSPGAPRLDQQYSVDSSHPHMTVLLRQMHVPPIGSSRRDSGHDAIDFLGLLDDIPLV